MLNAEYFWYLALIYIPFLIRLTKPLCSIVSSGRCKEDLAEMEQRYRVTAATGALEPVISKLTNLLDDRAEFAHLERWREDIQFVKSRLSSMYSLLLTIWDREDLRLDSACNEWMADARKLSYSVEEDIDSGVFADSSAFTQPKTDAVNPFEKLKNEVQKLINRCSEDWKTLGRTISEHHQPAEPNVDPIMSEFIHNDASELVEMDEKKYQLIRLLEEHHTVCIVGFAGMGKTTLADQVYQGIRKKFKSHAFVSLSRRPNVTRVLTSLCTQVMVSAITKRYICNFSYSVSHSLMSSSPCFCYS